MEKKRKSIAPQELGELPNEDRCPQCWALLTISPYQELDPEKVIKWCMNCGYAKSFPKE